MKISIHFASLNKIIRKLSVLKPFLFITLLSISCGKEKINADIKDVTGFVWKVYTVQEASDTYINPVPTDWQFQLNNNQSFSFSLGSSVCSGTYSWSTVDTVNASVILTIKEWNNPLQSSPTADKLKNIVKTINACYLFKSPHIPQNPAPPFSASTVLQFQGAAGVFYVYR